MAENDFGRRAREFMPLQEAESSHAAPLSPKRAMPLGGLADAASTYAFLKRGTGHEGNPMFQYFNQRPWTVIPTAAAGRLLYSLAYDRLRRLSPRAADIAAGIVGGAITWRWVGTTSTTNATARCIRWLSGVGSSF
jgi:hypothetical protein